MELRDAAMPDDPTPARPLPAEAPAAPRPATAPDKAPTEVSFRVDARMTALKIVGTVVFALIAIGPGADPRRTAVAGLGALVAAGFAARDLLAPRRLAADATGLTVVTGFAGRRHLDWPDIETVRLDERARLGLRSQALEVDTGEMLYLFGQYDLGMPCADAVALVEAVRSGTRS